jgi:hypothetical protein
MDKLIPTASIPTSYNSTDSTNSSHSFQYQLNVQTEETGEAISNARVIIEVLGQAPLEEFTDSNGFARIFIDDNHAGEPGRLTIEKDGYKKYVQNIDLDKKRLPIIVQLEPESNK